MAKKEIVKYICIKQFETKVFIIPNEYYVIEEGTNVEIFKDGIDHYDLTHSLVFRTGGNRYRVSILDKDLKHFIKKSELREQQINSILKD